MSKIVIRIFLISFIISTYLVGFSAEPAAAHHVTRLGTWTSVSMGKVAIFTVSGRRVECKKLTVNGKVRRDNAGQLQVPIGDHAVREMKHEECESGGNPFRNVVGTVQDIQITTNVSTMSYLTAMILKEEGTTCEIEIPATSANEGLSGVEVANLKTKEAEPELERKEAVSGITYNVSAGCVGLKGGTNGESKEVSVEKGIMSTEEKAGPFWYNREKGAKGGTIIGSPEAVSGEGGTQTLTGEIVLLKFEVAAKSVQTKGVLYNNALQGQIKLLSTYHEPKLLKPELKGCEVKLGTNNEVKTEGHLAWKWNGEPKQLEESPQSSQKPGIVFTPAAFESGAEKLPEGTLYELTLTGEGCGALKGKFPVKGNMSVTPKPANPEEWSTTLTTTSPGWLKQHLWNGNAFIGVEPSLTLSGSKAALTGEVKISPATEEIAIFEK